MGCGTSRSAEESVSELDSPDPKPKITVTSEPRNEGNAHQVTPKFNTIIIPEFEGAPTAKQWYHGSITNDEAEDRLKTTAKEDGNYLVYDFYDENGPAYGNYILLVYCGRKLYPWKISLRQDGRFILGEEDNTKRVKSYASVRKLIKAHRGTNGKPLPRPNDGRLVKLTPGYIKPIYNDTDSGVPASEIGASSIKKN